LTVLDRQTLVVWIVLLVLLATGIELVTHQLAIPWSIAGPSMEPTLRNGDRVIVDVWTYRQRPPRPGEVALLAPPSGGTAPLVKRVSARPDSQPLDPGTCWVLGDNLDQSLDSRSFGGVPATDFRGRVVWRYWPLSRLGPVR
jgi:nickel-type superoxide dismutase maturation protease